MSLTRHQLTLVLNALYKSGTRTIPVSHPCEEVGELLHIELGGPWDSTVRFMQGALSYQETREEILRKYGEQPHSDLPDENHYVIATIAGGLTDVGNQDEIAEFVEQHGYPDLEAGHHPVFVGIDTNLFPWRIQDALGVDLFINIIPRIISLRPALIYTDMPDVSLLSFSHSR